MSEFVISQLALHNVNIWYKIAYITQYTNSSYFLGGWTMLGGCCILGTLIYFVWNWCFTSLWQYNSEIDNYRNKIKHDIFLSLTIKGKISAVITFYLFWFANQTKIVHKDNTDFKVTCVCCERRTETAQPLVRWPSHLPPWPGKRPTSYLT